MKYRRITSVLLSDVYIFFLSFAYGWIILNCCLCFVVLSYTYCRVSEDLMDIFLLCQYLTHKFTSYVVLSHKCSTVGCLNGYFSYVGI
jgi:hypothetical protein